MAKDARSRPSADSSNRPESSDEKDKKSRRPANTAFRQQRLKAWQPILTPRTVIPVLFIIGVLFIPIGVLLYYGNTEIAEIVIEYSKCSTDSAKAPAWSDIPSDQVTTHFKKRKDSLIGTPSTWQHRTTVIEDNGVRIDTTICSLQFDIPNELKPPVLLYYRLTNFYQNHRRYVKSVDGDQLKGEAKSAGALEKDCDPVRVSEDGEKPYYPCGLIANSLFNDTFSSPVLMNTQNSSLDSMPYLMTNKGIAWSSDAHMYGKSAYKPEEVVPPPNWHKRYPNGYTNKTGLPDFRNDEAFQVWMRTAGLPDFSKLARRNITAAMPPGRYQIDIQDHFPVTEYGGTKSIMITTQSVLGGRNIYLFIVYFSVGGLCLFLGILFTILNCLKPRRLGDHSYLKFENDPPATSAGPGTGAGGGSGSGGGAPGTSGQAGLGSAGGVVHASGRKY